ncbi:hypothetical protein DPMN_097135 [Dreissena polymorpha]|uniref:Uncharacterized protein n=1 Tax=Dreissena polymorpha TaxID=45954 RepID=A0A9D4LAQ4_DREPO|nr:hypothetical protein DPMN_097135 [Dreissena polymorpha]
MGVDRSRTSKTSRQRHKASIRLEPTVIKESGMAQTVVEKVSRERSEGRRSDMDPA